MTEGKPDFLKEIRCGTKSTIFSGCLQTFKVVFRFYNLLLLMMFFFLSVPRRVKNLCFGDEEHHFGSSLCKEHGGFCLS